MIKKNYFHYNDIVSERFRKKCNVKNWGNSESRTGAILLQVIGA